MDTSVARSVLFLLLKLQSKIMIVNCFCFTSDGSLTGTKVSEPTFSRASFLKLAATTKSILSEYMRSSQAERDLRATGEAHDILNGELTLFLEFNQKVFNPNLYSFSLL